MSKGACWLSMSNLCFSSIMSPDSRRSMTWLNHSTLTCGVLKGLAMDKSCLLFGSCGRQINRVRIGILKLLWHFSEKSVVTTPLRRIQLMGVVWRQRTDKGSSLIFGDFGVPVWQLLEDWCVAWFWILSSLMFGKLHGVTSPCFQGLNKSILGVLGDPSGRKSAFQKKTLQLSFGHGLWSSGFTNLFEASGDV